MPEERFVGDGRSGHDASSPGSSAELQVEDQRIRSVGHAVCWWATVVISFPSASLGTKSHWP